MKSKRIAFIFFMLLLVTVINTLNKQDFSYILSNKSSLKPLYKKEIGVFEGFPKLGEKNC